MNRRILLLVAMLTTPLVAACNPLGGCQTDYRGALYYGVLGQNVAPATRPQPSDSGSVFIGLNEWQGGVTQQTIDMAVKVRGFMPTVSKVQVYAGTIASPGGLLWESSTGSLTTDTVWTSTGIAFLGPGTWNQLWSALQADSGFFRVISPAGDTVSAGLKQSLNIPFGPACT